MDHRKHYIIALLLLTLTALALLCFPQQFSFAGESNAQKRPVRPTPSPAVNAPAGKDYTKFSHSTKEHTGACKTCHKLPTDNWKKVREFPDVADFPDHEACVRCHKSQFFKGAQPPICTDCHLKSSPKDDARTAFRNP